MKTIIKSVFLTAILTLMVTGCQKEGNDFDVSLKSTIAFTGGIYMSPWQSGDAEFECAQAGGCDGGSYKFDYGVYAGAYFNEGGVTVTGISKQEFSWTSIYPVCKIIVKAGNGAYIFDIGGAQSGSVPYPKDLNVKEKDISHITFCFGLPPSPVVIAVKVHLYIAGTDYLIGEGKASAGTSYGTNVFPDCYFTIGYNDFPNDDNISSWPILDLYYKDEIGTVSVVEGVNSLIVTVDLKNNGLLKDTYIYVGSLQGLLDTEAETGGCPNYRYNTNWLFDGTDANSVSFTVPY